MELAYETGEDVSQFYLLLYDGGSGTTYGDTHLVSDALGSGVSSGGLSFVYFDLPSLRHSQSTGEGIALVDGGSGAVIEFISYDGQFVASEGAANGMESVNIGVSERDSVEEGFSLQLGGSGCSRSDFSWQASQAATKGALNSGQFGACVPGEPSPIPSMLPSAAPSVFPSEDPSGSPSRPPSEYPSVLPSSTPSSSLKPSVSPVSCCTGIASCVRQWFRSLIQWLLLRWLFLLCQFAGQHFHQRGSLLE